MKIHCFFSGTKEKKGTPGQKGNPGHFAMKFVNLRNRERQPSFVTIKVPDIKFKIDSLSCELKKGTIKVNSSEKDVVQHIALAFVTSTLYLLVQPRPPVIPKGAIGQVQAWAKKANGKNVRPLQPIWILLITRVDSIYRAFEKEFSSIQKALHYGGNLRLPHIMIFF